MDQRVVNLAKYKVADMVSRFEDGLEQYRSADYNETQLRIDFVNRFFTALGWDVANGQGLPQHLREVVHEANVTVDEDGILYHKKPDYSFRVGTETMFFLETKKPSVDITTDNAPAFQLRRYGWSRNLGISVLTNFTDLYIYDCSVRPISGDDVSVAMLAHFHYTEYVQKFDLIYGMLSREAVIDGSFEDYFGDTRDGVCREPFDRYFLDQVKGWRNSIGADVLLRHPDTDDETLNIFVQRILNRIIFLRICEDRHVEKYATLRHVTTYGGLMELFKATDRKYDSGLFEMAGEDALTVSDKTITDILQSLYYPNSPYEFSVVDPYIIGQIYELFLAETLSADPDGHVHTVLKAEIVASNGAVNTPKGIADIIVKETLDPLYVGKTPDEVCGYRIADICCGSGNFLLSAFEYVVNYHTEYYRTMDPEASMRRGDIHQFPGSSDYLLSYAKKRTILKNNIFGVDIDPLAVEVAKFSLLLKVFEGTSLDELLAYKRHARQRILPNIDENIKTGNSLVDSSFAAFHPDVYSDANLMGKLKMFDWDDEYSDASFDAIVGNPPYIRVQNMVQYSHEEYVFYKSGFSPYNVSKSDTLDKYYLFIERGLSLLRENGMLGYIIPHKFMKIASGRELRTLLSQNRHVRRIIHFGTSQVFPKRDTYTCILLLSKKPVGDFDIGFVSDVSRFLLERCVKYTSYPSSYISGMPWSFLPQSLVRHMENIAPLCAPLADLADIFVGVQTSADNVYIIHTDDEDDDYVYSHTELSGAFRIEKGILRQSVYDAKLSSYEKVVANSHIIFPYKSVDGKPVLYGMDEMRERFPEALRYLESVRPELDKRKMDRRHANNWYAFGRSQSIRRFLSGEHLLWPVLSIGPNYVYDDAMTVFTGGGNGPFYGLEMKTSSQESIFYVQAILNHWLAELLVKNKASVFRGDYYSHGKQYVGNIPIYRIDFTVPGEVKKHDDIVAKVEEIMRLKEQMNASHNTVRRQIFERSANAVNRELDLLIDSLYQIEESKDEFL